jgi:N-formylmaleamate deformylase
MVDTTRMATRATDDTDNTDQVSEIASKVIRTLIGVLAVLAFGLGTALAGPRPAFQVEVIGRGPAMIFIPGLNSSGAVWNSVVEHFQDRYTCHVLTLAGFAGQPPIEPPFLPVVRDAVLQYIDERRLERPVIVGHSLGGFLALWIGATAPDRVGPIVAVDGVPFLPALMNPSATADTARVQAEAIRTAMRNASAEERAQQSAMSLAAMISDPAHVKVAEQWAAASDPATTRQAIVELMTTDLRSDVQKITAPVLLVAAAGQFASSPGALEQIEKSYERQLALIPQHQTIVAGKARHFVMLDDREFLTQAIDAFLVRHSR